MGRTFRLSKVVSSSCFSYVFFCEHHFTPQAMLVEGEKGETFHFHAPIGARVKIRSQKRGIEEPKRHYAGATKLG